MKLYLITLGTAAAFLVGCEQRNVEQASKQFNQLPAAVQKTVRAQAPDAEIADIDQKTRDGVTVYQIQFRDKERHPAMEVATDGTLMRYEAGKPAAGAPGTVEGRVKGAASSMENQISALPMSVQKAIQANAPRAEVVDINRKEDNGRVFYEIQYAGKDHKPVLQVGEDGHIYKLPTEEAKPEKR
ncbi:MAG TPA: PepSY-like domain-containing protein [Verrucomicrobiae bacterium]|nr:PepSY-like domain-containing protein [Verrucomicrobiae bacterium]